MLEVTRNHIGPYELRSELGHGAMARVWRAWDPNLEREVAIKVPSFGAGLSSDMLEDLGHRFVAEGRAAARLSHPGIVTVYAADVWDGVPAIVMELVDGSTLSSLLDLGPLPAPAALNVLDQLLDAVGYAHAHGVVHRDIKPDNIFVSASGAVKLADFGIAHVDGGAASHATVAGTVLGTPGYLSPEQARGTAVDARSDLFSIGVVAYEMLTGYNPFGAGRDADATTLIYRIVHEPVPELPESASAGLPADLRPAIMAALSKDPNDRPPSAEAFKAMLHGSAQGWAPVAAQSTPVAQAVSTRAAQQKSAPSWLPYVVVLAVGLVALGIVFISATSGPRGGGGSAPVAATTTDTSAAVTAEEPSEASTEAAEEAAEASSEAAETALYLGISDGGVALFAEGRSEPISMMGLLVSEMTSEDAAALGAGVSVSSFEDASLLVESYKLHAQEAAEQQEVMQANYPPVFNDAIASSELPGDSITSYYGALNVLNEDYTLSWNEGADGAGVGEWVMVRASQEQRVSGIKIMNGYPKTEEIYYKNNRCHDIAIELSDGYTTSVTLDDAYRSYQTIDFGGEHATTYIKITIKSAYEGSKWEDTSISAIQVY